MFIARNRVVSVLGFRASALRVKSAPADHIGNALYALRKLVLGF